MSRPFASGRRAIAICDRCGFEYPLVRLKKLTIKTKLVNMLVCPSCWETDHPQNLHGLYPVNDPQAIQNPRPDNTYWQGGTTGIRTNTWTPPLNGVPAYGTPSGGSRVIQWGWQPVGLDNTLGLTGLVNSLVVGISVGTVIAGGS